MPTLAGGRGLHLERTVTVLRPAEDVYRAWRDLERLRRLLRLVSVTPSGHGGRVRSGCLGGLQASTMGECTQIGWRGRGSLRHGGAPTSS